MVQEKSKNMTNQSFQDEFINFIDNSYTPAHFIAIAREKLLKAGYTEVSEKSQNENTPNKFFIVRDHRAIVCVNRVNFDAGVVIGGHIDSPVFKVTKNSKGFGNHCEFNKVSRYGGQTSMTWMDRDLQIAGRVVIQKDGKLYAKTIQSEKAVCVIPSLACHLISSGIQPNLVDANFRPIFSLSDRNPKESTLERIISELCDCTESEIVDYDISLVSAEKATRTGLTGDLIHSTRLDDLSCSIPALNAFLSIDKPKTGTIIFSGFDNEEIGSGSKCGARSNLINSALKLAGADNSFLHRSLIISTDVNHGYNPNFSSYYDKDHRVSLGQGLMWFFTNVTSRAASSLVQNIANKEGIPLFPFANRHGQSSGSTIGTYMGAMHGALVIDVGIPLLAMHSIRELASFKDIENLYKFSKAIYDHIDELIALRKSID